MYAKLNPWKFGLAAAILWGVGLFIMTWVSMLTGWGMFWLSQWIDVYPGFELSTKGTFIGLVYGLIDGFVSMFLLAWLYNLFQPQRGEKK